MSWSDFKKKYKGFEDSLDLNKHYPNYFDKRIFRGMLIVIMGLFLVSFFSNGGVATFVWSECLSNHSCLNPFYLCSNNNVSSSVLSFNNSLVNSVDSCLSGVSWDIKYICDYGNCERRYLNPNELIGVKPNFIAKYFKIFVSLIVLFAFGFNHYLYKRKQGVNNGRL